MAEFGAVLVILLLLMGGYWSFFVFPRQREFSQRQQFVRTLSEGDEVVTFGGMIGRVIDIESETGLVHVEIAEGVVVRFVAASIVSQFNPEEIAENAQRSLTEANTMKETNE